MQPGSNHISIDSRNGTASPKKEGYVSKKPGYNETFDADETLTIIHVMDRRYIYFREKDLN